MTKENERADMISIIRYVLIKDFETERTKKYKEKLEEIKMSSFVDIETIERITNLSKEQFMSK